MNTKPTPTIDNINEFTAAEIISFIGINLLKQGQQSRVGTRCAYRGSYSTKCAVGFLIPDDVYGLDLERYGNAESLTEKLGYKYKHSDESFDAVCRLQCMHDIYRPGDWREKLLNIAMDFNCYNEVLKTFIEAGV